MGDILQERDDNTYTSASNIAVTRKVQSDTNNRYQQFPDGKMEWGSGSATPDVNLYRSAANVLATDDTLSIGAGLIDAYTQTDPSSSVNIPNYGTTVLPSSTAKTYTLDAPSVGVIKYLHCTANSTTIQTVNANSTSVTFDGTNDSLTFDGINEAVILKGLSATRWLVMSNVGSVGIS